MTGKEEEFRKRLLATFKVEVEEHLAEMSSGLLELEKAKSSSDQSGIIEVIFREAHSLKGAARAVNMNEIEAVCKSLESIFNLMKLHRFKSSPSSFDVLHQSLDYIKLLLAEPDQEKSIVYDKGTEVLRLLKELETRKASDLKEFTVTEEVKNIVGDEIQAQAVTLKQETIRISKPKLDSILRQTEELLSVKLKMIQHSDELRTIKSQLDKFKLGFYKDYFIQNRNLPQSDGVKTGMKSEGRIVIPPGKQHRLFNDNYGQIKSIDNTLSSLIKSSHQDQRIVGGMIRNLLNDIRKTLMQPFNSLLEVFPKLVRDLTREQGKEIELVIKGAEQEIDRRILEQMKDPLIHLVRNCIDHGIEKPKERVINMKPESGKITISVTQPSANWVEIIVADDGKGIDLSSVKKVAANQGLTSDKDLETMNEEDAKQLIFNSGISTSPIITDISGRGLGMAIVREKVESVGGAIKVSTELNKGTSICITLPLTVATFRGTFIKTSGQIFVIPTKHIERILRIRADKIKSVENRLVIPFNGRTCSFVPLEDILEIRNGSGSVINKTDFIQVLIIGSGSKQIATGVDEVLNEHEILVKQFKKPLVRVRNIEGVAVLGSGQAVPILNVSDMVRTSMKDTITTEKIIDKMRETEKQKSVLIAEDSITARMLLKDILESAGYNVKTAVDGAEALSFLRENNFNILVSDIEMPRMNGFELTASVRKDKKLSELPVVLVTALQSREDRERGMEVGANAYIEKGSFNPQNLLNVMKKLV